LNENHFIQQKESKSKVDYHIKKRSIMAKKSSISIFIAATSALAISTAIPIPLNQ